MSKFCTNCGTEVADNVNFCPSCGTNLTAPVQPVQQVYQQPVYQQPVYQQVVQAPQARPVKTPVRGRGFGIASLVLGIIGFVFCLIVLIIALSMISTYRFSSSWTGLGYLGAVIAIYVSTPPVLLSLIFSIIGMAKGYKRQAIAGLVLSVLCVSIIVFFFITAS